MKLLGKGSAKDIYQDPKAPGYIALDFSDRVSVFDYGALPDSIEMKGKSLKSAAESLFQLLEENGVATAYEPERSAKSDFLYLKAAYDGKFFSDPCGLKFLPVEVIFRWGVPEGSSLLKRGNFRAFERFSEPMVEFTTKLEARDRLIDDAEMATLIGSPLICEKLRATATQVAFLLNSHFKKIGLELWDGKIECAWDEAAERIVVVDSLGPDEFRANLPGLRRVSLSKEMLRQWLAQTNWSFDCQRMKKEHGDHWKNFLGPVPRLGNWRKQRISGMYVAFSQALMAQEATPLWDWLKDDRVKPKVFILGSGGREAAVKWRLEQEGCDIAETLDEGVDAAWVSMDADLAAGKVEEWEAQGIWTYGPRKEGAKLEWSKQFGRDFAAEAGLKNPRVTSSWDEAKTFGNIPVVKKDSLAAGKGVVVAETLEEAKKAFDEFSQDSKVLLEERCTGPEASAFFSIVTGYYGAKVQFLGSAQDFKRRYAGDEGPNTGGMGSYAPSPSFTLDDEKEITDWAQKTADLLFEKGLAYNGILYLGLMRDPEKGWVLIEYNSRFGDPETQALVKLWPTEHKILRSLLSLDFSLPRVEIPQDKASLCLALVRPEYPLKAPEGFILPEWKLPEGEATTLFQSGSVGGRVAYLVAVDASISAAGDHVFETLLHSPWKELLEWRPDILP